MEFESDASGKGTVVLKFEKNTELEAGNKYSVDVTASENKFLYQEGTKQHQADSKETADPNLTFTVKKEEVVLEKKEEEDSKPKRRS